MRGTGKNVKKKSKPPDDKQQSQRFVETAKALGIDESGNAFTQALKSILPSKARQKVSARKPKSGTPKT